MSERAMTPISDRELERRWRAVREVMKAQGLDALVMQNSNDFLGGTVKWFTDVPAKFHYPRSVIFYADAGMSIVEMGGKGTVLSLGGKDPMHRGVDTILHTPSFFSVGYTHNYHAELLVSDLKRHGARAIGWILPGALPHRLITSIEKELGPGATFTDVTEAIDQIKAIKSEEELALIRATAKMQDKVFARLLDVIRPGTTDAELVAICEHEGRLNGSEQGIFLGSSAPLGERAGYLDSHFHGRTLNKGDHFTVLIENNGAGGFYTELSRTIVLGKSSDELITTFAAMKAAQDHTLSLLKPGARCADIAAAHDAYMERNGFPPETRLYCHGQGYDLVERPLIRADETMTIKENMSIVVHPGVATDRLWSVICDNYIIEKTGPGDCLHATEKKIFEL